MKITVLVENTSTSDDFMAEPGLSLYIETKGHKLLFDAGISDHFIGNAEKMGIDLAAVDTVVLSHGHYDHGGGLKAFFNINSKAPVYITPKAFDKHFVNLPSGDKVYIGLDPKLISEERFIVVGDGLKIDDELELFSNVQGKKFWPSGNQDLLMMAENEMVNDDFVHEQNLVIKEDGKSLLLAGCAHNGIVNIVEHYQGLYQGFPDCVLGGFHLYNPSRNLSESAAVLFEIAEYLKTTGAKFYTGHCTGIEPYNYLKDNMGEQIDYMAVGSHFTI